MVKKATMLIDIQQSEEARMGMLKECVLYVAKKGTMPMDDQQSIRRLDPMILDYIASSVEKIDTLPVGVKRRMMINPRTESLIAIHSVRRHQLVPLPGRMTRIPQPDENVVILQFSCHRESPR